MRILGIETSCDETSVAVVDDGCTVLSNVIASSVQDFLHAGGVIPEIAARRQMEYILPVVDRALLDAATSPGELDAIAVTRGPGLLTSLIVGAATARALVSVWKKPLLGVHHMLGHRSSAWLEHREPIRFPLLTLSISGGHTEIILCMSHLETHLLSATRDDAAGEAFDKGARLLGLPYPGGPALAQLAARGDAAFYRFPRPLSGTDTMDFSFSGLKTALKYYLRDHGGSDNLSPQERSGIAASYQKAIIDHLLSRIEKALDQQDGIQEVHVVGGVAANQYLRKVFSKLPCSVRYPAKIEFCTDNAAMIAAAGYFMVQELGTSAFKAFPTLAADSL